MPLSRVELLVVTAEIRNPVESQVPGISQYDRTMRLVDHLRALNCIVHIAHGHSEALSIYWMLFRRGQVPRAVVTEWQLRPTGSDGYAMAMMLKRQADCTAYDTINNIRTMDPEALVIVMRDTFSSQLPSPESLLNEIITLNHPVEPSEIVSTLQQDDNTTREQARRQALLDRTERSSDTHILTRSANLKLLAKARASVEEARDLLTPEPTPFGERETQPLIRRIDNPSLERRP